MYIPPNVDTSCGIYRIKNLRNGKCYLGSSVNIPERKAEHFRLLNKGAHDNNRLQNAWNKEQDKSVFEFQVFIYCKTDDLRGIEQSCLNIMNPEYNISKDATAPMRGRKHSDETRAKMKKRVPWNKGLPPEKQPASKRIGPDNPMFGRTGEQHPCHGHHPSGKDHHQSMPIVEVGSQIVYASIGEASRKLGVPAGNICKVCKGERKSTGGYKFEYV
jgi:group I intron endonuclease